MAKKNLAIQPCDFDTLSEATNSAYESIVAVSKRSKDLCASARFALRAEFAELNIKEGGDNNFVDSNIQELVSKRYEMADKPLLIALRELLTGKLNITYEDNTLYKGL